MKRSTLGSGGSKVQGHSRPKQVTKISQRAILKTLDQTWQAHITVNVTTNCQQKSHEAAQRYTRRHHSHPLRSSSFSSFICILTLYWHIKPQSNGPLWQYGDWYTGRWWMDSWLLHLVQRGGTWAGCGPAQSPPCCTKCNSPPINGQCANFISFDVAQ